MRWGPRISASRVPGCFRAVTFSVGGVARPLRAHALVLGGARQGAQVTARAPAPAPGAAALRLGDLGTVGRGHLAERLQSFCETEALPVVWGGGGRKHGS